MGNKRLKKELRTIYQVSSSDRKYIIINDVKNLRKNHTITPLSIMIRKQIKYLRLWGLLSSIGAFILALYLAREIENNPVWFISALLPVVAYVGIAEVGRSERYGMNELELTTTFSLKMIVMTRLCAAGICNLLLMILLCPIMILFGNVTLTELGFVILCPYLLTSFLCIYFIRRYRSPENLYGCIGIAFCVSMLCVVFGYLQIRILELMNLGSSIVILFALIFLTANEIKKWIVDTEEYAWNL